MAGMQYGKKSEKTMYVSGASARSAAAGTVPAEELTFEPNKDGASYSVYNDTSEDTQLVIPAIYNVPVVWE